MLITVSKFISVAVCSHRKKIIAIAYPVLPQLCGQLTTSPFVLKKARAIKSKHTFRAGNQMIVFRSKIF
jgi:hypothetical protein